MTINHKTVKKLYGLSAGLCNICKCNLVEDNVVIGEMAHIIARSPKGPRGDNNKSQNNTYDNLILLCPNHHKIVDTEPEKYPAGLLRDIKNKHESFIKNRLSNKNKEYEQDLSSLNLLFEFIPILSLKIMVSDLPYKLSLEFMDITDTFINFMKGNPESYPFWNKELTKLWEAFILAVNNLNEFMLSNICGDTFYPFSEGSSKGECYNIYIGDGHDAVINKQNLSGEQVYLIENKVSGFVQSLIFDYTNLVNYIRHNFRDIKW